MNDRGLEINWVAGKPTPMIGSKRCSPVVRSSFLSDRKGWTVELQINLLKVVLLSIADQLQPE